MQQGGARIRSGSPADPNSLRSMKNAGDWLLLPLEGRPGDVPPWPITLATDRELELWNSNWRRPQAVAWERFELHEQVALYCRRWAEAEERNSPIAASTLARQMADALGLTMPGMNSLRWKFATDETAPRRAARPAATPAVRTSSRSRLEVASGGSGA